MCEGLANNISQIPPKKCKSLLVKAFTTTGELSPSCPRAYTLKMYSAVGISPEKVISVWSGNENSGKKKTT